MPGAFDFLGDLFGGGGGDSGGSFFGDMFGGGGSGGDLFGGGGSDFGLGNIDYGNLFGSGSGGGGGLDLGNLFGAGGGGGVAPSTDWSSLFGGGAPIDSISGGIAPSLSNLNLGNLNTITSPGGGSPIDSVTAGIAPNLAGISAGGVNGLTNLVNGAVPSGDLNNVGAGLNPGLANILRGLTGGTAAGGTPATAGSVPGTGNNGVGVTPGGTGTSNPLSGILGTGLTLPQILAGLGLGGSLLNGNKLPPGADALKAQADKNQQLVDNQIMPTALANQQGNINGQALSAIDRRLQQSEAGMREKYAAMGMSGSTMEQEDLAGLRSNAQDQVFAEGQQMATTGLQTAAALTGQDTGIYEALMQAQVQQDEELSKAIAAFAGAASR